MPPAKRARIENADTFPAADATNSVQLSFDTPITAPFALTIIVGCQDTLLALPPKVLSDILPNNCMSFELWKA